jgi:protein arginine kinase
LRENRQSLQERISGAYGFLCSAMMITAEEVMDMLSFVRLGVNLSLLDDTTIQTVNELLIHIQPANLQKRMGVALDGEARNDARAHYLRTRLRA